jgi:outer membrane protein insertion porin family
LPVLALTLFSLVCGLSVAAARPSDLSEVNRVLEDAGAWKGWEVATFEIQGPPEDVTESLMSGLALAGEKSLLSEKTPLFYPSVLQEDLDRARLYMARHGHPFAAISPIVEPIGADREVQVILSIESGPPVILTRIALAGFPEHLVDAASELAAVRPGSRFEDDAVEASTAAMQELLLDEGYARATVTADVESEDSTRVLLRFLASPGKIHRFGRVFIEGTREDFVPLVRKTVGIREGMTHSPDTIEEAQNRLRLLDLFRQIRIRPVYRDEDIVDLQVTLIDRPPHTLDGGIGYWSDDLLRVHARWQHRNLLLRGRGFEALGIYSTVNEAIEGTFWWPAFLKADVRGELKGRLEWESEESYDLFDRQVGLSARYRPSFRTTYRTGVTLSDVEIDEKTDEPEAVSEENRLLTILSGAWNFDSSNDHLNPSGGRVAWINIEVTAPRLSSDHNYLSTEGAGALYHSLFHRTVVASRLRLGWAHPIAGTNDLLPNEEFYAGGSNSMRGFKRRMLGPLDSSGTPLGGQAKIEWGSELRFPIWGILGGAAFLDAGQVWQEIDRARLDEMEVAVGGGLVIYTPIGPIRGDIGHRLTDMESSQPETVYHISIGHPF